MKRSPYFVFTGGLLLVLISACVPKIPGITVSVKHYKDCGSQTKSQILSVLSEMDDSLIFAPSPGYPDEFPGRNFDGVWSDFGSKYFVSATAVFQKNDRLRVGVSCDASDGEVLFYLDEHTNDKLSQIAIKQIDSLLMLLRNRYREDEISVVRMVGL
jgi:hypothetical protein